MMHSIQHTDLQWPKRCGKRVLIKFDCLFALLPSKCRSFFCVCAILTVLCLCLFAEAGDRLQWADQKGDVSEEMH